MHPFYGPSERLARGGQPSSAGLASMGAYLGFWAVVVALGWRELDARFPRQRVAGDRALSIARERLARGEIGADEYRQLRAVLAEEPR